MQGSSSGYRSLGPQHFPVTWSGTPAHFRTLYCPQGCQLAQSAPAVGMHLYKHRPQVGFLQ